MAALSELIDADVLNQPESSLRDDLTRECDPAMQGTRRNPVPSSKEFVKAHCHVRSAILVTGGAGFLGSHLCERLIRAGEPILCLDNLFTSRKNSQHLMDCPDFEFIRHDVMIPLYVEVSGIFNLACPASPVHYTTDPVQTVKTSVHGAINMLGLDKRFNRPSRAALAADVVSRSGRNAAICSARWRLY